MSVHKVELFLTLWTKSLQFEYAVVARVYYASVHLLYILYVRVARSRNIRQKTLRQKTEHTLDWLQGTYALTQWHVNICYLH